MGATQPWRRRYQARRARAWIRKRWKAAVVVVAMMYVGADRTLEWIREKIVATTPLKAADAKRLVPPRRTPVVRFEIEGNRGEPGILDPEGAAGECPLDGVSDIIRIFTDDRLVASFELKDLMESKELKDLPPVSLQFERPLQTTLKARAVDLDGDGVAEILIWVAHGKFILHPDHLVLFLVVDSSGQVRATAPAPPKLDFVEPRLTGPYAAFGRYGRLFEIKSRTSWAIAYANAVVVRDAGGVPELEFAWVIDGAAYVSDHVFAVERFRYRDGQLERSGSEPKFVRAWIGEGDDLSGDSVSEPEAKDFVHANRTITAKEVAALLRATEAAFDGGIDAVKPKDRAVLEAAEREGRLNLDSLRHPEQIEQLLRRVDAGSSDP